MNDTILHERAAAVRQGQRRAVARAITLLENQAPGADALLDALYPATGTAWRIGVTGPPGAGKSTLVNGLIRQFRTEGHTVGVVAVDPSSPFSGGALLGDRIRMDLWYDDPGVFIRSVATRGALGGLSLQTEAVADVLDAAGYDVLLLETVGVGQAELDVARAADSVAVVLVPESGDAVQAMKAGLMEIADVFCVNKADHPDADALVHTLRAMLHLRPDTLDAWRPVVVKTVATRAEGLEPLLDALQAHRTFLHDTDQWNRNRDDRLRARVHRLVWAAWNEQFWTPERQTLLDRAVGSLDPHDRTPHALAARLIDSADGR